MQPEPYLAENARMASAGTETKRKDDILQEYRNKEAMTPAKGMEHEPSAG